MDPRILSCYGCQFSIRAIRVIRVIRVIRGRTGSLGCWKSGPPIARIARIKTDSDPSCLQQLDIAAIRILEYPRVLQNGLLDAFFWKDVFV